MDTRYTEIKIYNPSPLSDNELLSIFPEAKGIILQKIAEYKEERENLISNMQSFHKRVKAIAQEQNFDEFFIWFWGDAYLKYFYAPFVIKIDRHLQRLRRQLLFFIKPDKALAWEEAKELAGNQSLYDIALPYLKKFRQIGNRITALCPFHTEKTPSFTIFLNQNSYHCFGCQAHGNVITFYMTINKVLFTDAVKELAK